MSVDINKHSESENFLIVEFRPFNKRSGNYLGIASDFSEEGFMIESQYYSDLSQGEILDIKLKHPRVESEVAVTGEIILTKASWYKHITGIKFHNTAQSAINKLFDLISSDKGKEPETAGTAGRVESSILKAYYKNDHDMSDNDTLYGNMVHSENSDLNIKGMKTPALAADAGRRIIEIAPPIYNKLANRTWMYMLAALAVVILLGVKLPSIYGNPEIGPEFKEPVIAKSTLEPEQQSVKPDIVSINQEQENTDRSTDVLPEEKIETLRAADNIEKQYVVSVYNLNVRADPSTKSPIVGKLNRGELFILKESKVSDEGLWLKMDIGYVLAIYTIEVAPAQQS